jgi:hypothetical protein
MSITANTQRRDERALARLERSEAIGRLIGLINRAAREGLNDEQTVRFLAAHRGEFALPAGQQPIGYHEQTVWRLKVFLGLANTRQPKAKRVGRLNARKSLDEVRP